jgi:RNA polymerase sigma factor (sigma-70 family)
MIDENEAQQLMAKLLDLRDQAKLSEDPKIKIILGRHEKVCMNKFRYLITMKTNRYKSFSNYDDLNQEGYEALIKAMNNYNPKKGSFFWWAHKYIDTRISRSANLYTTIRFPLKIAKEQPPHKESTMPVMLEEKHIPELEVQVSQNILSVRNVLLCLNDEHKEIVSLAFGIKGDKPMSINRICKTLKISRSYCLKSIYDALDNMREHIKI